MKKRKRKVPGRMPDKPGKNFTQSNPDEAVLNLLSTSRADLSKRRLINFYLYFPTQEKAKIAGNELTNLGLEVEYAQSSDERNWLCLASKDLVPSFSSLNSIRKKLESIASKLGGFYDGWETGLDADESDGLLNNQ
jgi:hypothetical protein